MKILLFNTLWKYFGPNGAKNAHILQIDAFDSLKSSFYCWNLIHVRFFHNRSLIKDISFKISSILAHFRAPVGILGPKVDQKYLYNSKVIFSSDKIYLKSLKLCTKLDNFIHFEHFLSFYSLRSNPWVLPIRAPERQ